MRVSVWMTIHLCSKELVDVSRMVRNISRKNTWCKLDRQREITCQYKTKQEVHGHRIHTDDTGSPNAVLCTSICILRCTLKWESKVRKIASDSSKTSGTEETPFLDSATHKYCLMALTNISWVRNTGPAPCSTDSSSCRDTILDRNSWDLQRRGIACVLITMHQVKIQTNPKRDLEPCRNVWFNVVFFK